MSGLMVWPAGPSTPPDNPNPAEDGEDTAYRLAVKAHPDCDECRSGKGTTRPGPRHSKVHRGHCSCSGCF